ncbi:MAG: c-type cytochrome [Bryobacteraceae bacterium]|jgi:mono/diheme cytochrome c family protein
MKVDMMNGNSIRMRTIYCVALLASGIAWAQTGDKATVAGSAAAIAGSKQNPEAVGRGAQVFAAKCASCHGATAKGANRGPDLVRSVLLLDDEKGILVSPVIRNGRPDKGMPKLNLTEDQISDVVAWLHVQTYAADHRNTFVFLDVVTGDPKKGEAYFNGAGGCAGCHSPTGDLKGIAGKYDPHELQGRWLQPRSFGRGSNATTVTVTLPSGQQVGGTLDRIDDFNVSLHDANGDYHSFNRDGATPKVEIHNPLKAHTDLLRKYTDADIHNVTAYLVTLK